MCETELRRLDFPMERAVDEFGAARSSKMEIRRAMNGTPARSGSADDAVVNYISRCVAPLGL
jgi:hypothetical protein